MIDRWTQGILPEKPHTVFRDAATGALFYEECFTREGFDGPYSILYHRRPPTDEIASRASSRGYRFEIAAGPGAGGPPLRRLYDTGRVAAGGPMLEARVPLLHNSDVTISAARPDRSDDVLFVNADGDDLFFVESGEGEVESTFGILPFRSRDYVVIPRGCPHRFLFSTAENRLFGVECRRGFHVPKQFRNEAGQLRMDAAYTHRDFVRPVLSDPARAAAAPRRIVTKRADAWSERDVPSSPLDVVGWDGVAYPIVFPILKFQAKTGLIHLPPTIHITFAAGGAVICSFVPRVTDTHANAIPCPYPHSSVDCDEVIFYVDGSFTSRRGVGPGAVSFHPAGVPHGPHPGAYEASIGTTSTKELAVMIDTFLPLAPTAAARQVEDGAYHSSWRAPDSR